MMFKKTALLFLLFLFIGHPLSYGQRFAISNNLLFDAAGALSAGVEIPFSRKTSLEVYGSLRSWKRASQNVNKHWTVQTQFRIWPCQVMNGFFFGPYAHVGEFNLGNQDLFFGLLHNLRPFRYEGWFVGGGLGAGYQFTLSKHWNFGVEAGVGYTYIDYRKYNCELCGTLKEDDVLHYVGVSRLGLSFIYLF
jgi:hypothetical protein